MKKTTVTTGVYWVEIPEVHLRILCGAPADVVKHLMRGGFITEVERNGVRWESGPNAILLSDVSIQNGDFSNLAEFPVLQMFYRQGTIIPGHPNNTGTKPMIIGAADQVAAQRDYIFRGNYGLATLDELIAAGLDRETAEEYHRIKTTFAFGNIRSPEEMIDFVTVDNDPVEIAPGTDIERVAVNTYRISYGGDYLEVSLNLKPTEQYRPPYMLGQHKIKREYFSVVHTGEGDGWDINRPCMAAILVFQGRVYLIDAGPSVMHTLNSLGISVNEIDGIFHTHAHDDHFAGLTSLVRADHRLPYYAAPMVRASVMKKLSALMSFPEDQFDRYFVPHDLTMDAWNMIDGLEVMPVYSPHPVETTVMFFRTLWDDGYKTYAHFADICSFSQLDALVDEGSETSRRILDKVRHDYLIPTDVKKLDIGGGMIHGRAEDFRYDESPRIVLSHTSAPLTLSEKEIGADTSFGMTDVLIRASRVMPESRIVGFLSQNYPDVPQSDILMVSNFPSRTMSVGSILVKKNAHPTSVFLLVNGLLELLDSETAADNILTAGTMVGEITCLFGEASRRTYRAASFIHVMEIPGEIYRAFIRRNGLEERMRRFLKRKHFLEGTSLLGDRIATETRNAIVHEMEEQKVTPGTTIVPDDSLILVAEGSVEVRCHGKRVTTVGVNEALGEPALLEDTRFPMTYVAAEPVRLFRIPCTVLDHIPIVRWKLLEQLNRRVRTCNAIFQP